MLGLIVNWQVIASMLNTGLMADSVSEDGKHVLERLGALGFQEKDLTFLRHLLHDGLI